MSKNTLINWNKLKKTSDDSTNLCLSIIYKYRCVDIRPLKTILLSPYRFDKFALYWNNKGINVIDNQLTIDGVIIKRGVFVKWEYECEFYPEEKPKKKDILTFGEIKPTSYPNINIPELDNMYKNGDIKYTIKYD